MNAAILLSLSLYRNACLNITTVVVCNCFVSQKQLFGPFVLQRVGRHLIPGRDCHLYIALYIFHPFLGIKSFFRTIYTNIL